MAVAYNQPTDSDHILAPPALEASGEKFIINCDSNRLPSVVSFKQVSNKHEQIESNWLDNTFRQALLRAQARIKRGYIPSVKEEWRLPHAPVPSRPDFSRVVLFRDEGRRRKRGKHKRSDTVPKTRTDKFSEPQDILPPLPIHDYQTCGSLDFLPQRDPIHDLTRRVLRKLKGAKGTKRTEQKRTEYGLYRIQNVVADLSASFPLTTIKVGTSSKSVYLPFVGSASLHPKPISRTVIRQPQYLLPELCHGCRVLTHAHSFKGYLHLDNGTDDVVDRVECGNGSDVGEDELIRDDMNANEYEPRVCNKRRTKHFRYNNVDIKRAAGDKNAYLNVPSPNGHDSDGRSRNLPWLRCTEKEHADIDQQIQVTVPRQNLHQLPQCIVDLAKDPNPEHADKIKHCEAEALHLLANYSQFLKSRQDDLEIASTSGIGTSIKTEDLDATSSSAAGTSIYSEAEMLKLEDEVRIEAEDEDSKDSERRKQVAEERIQTEKELKKHLYHAPKAFKIQKHNSHPIIAEDPFTKERSYNIPKPRGFKVRKSDKAPTEHVEFKRDRSSCKYAKELHLHKGPAKASTADWKAPKREERQKHKTFPPKTQIKKKQTTVNIAPKKRLDPIASPQEHMPSSQIKRKGEEKLKRKQKSEHKPHEEHTQSPHKEIKKVEKKTVKTQPPPIKKNRRDVKTNEQIKPEQVAEHRPATITDPSPVQAELIPLLSERTSSHSPLYSTYYIHTAASPPHSPQIPSLKPLPKQPQPSSPNEASLLIPIDLTTPPAKDPTPQAKNPTPPLEEETPLIKDPSPPTPEWKLQTGSKVETKPAKPVTKIETTAADPVPETVTTKNPTPLPPPPEPTTKKTLKKPKAVFKVKTPLVINEYGKKERKMTPVPQPCIYEQNTTTTNDSDSELPEEVEPATEPIVWRKWREYKSTKKKVRAVKASTPISSPKPIVRDALDFLARYCIVHKQRIPNYQRIFKNHLLKKGVKVDESEESDEEGTRYNSNNKTHVNSLNGSTFTSSDKDSTSTGKTQPTVDDDMDKLEGTSESAEESVDYSLKLFSPESVDTETKSDNEIGCYKPPVFAKPTKKPFSVVDHLDKLDFILVNLFEKKISLHEEIQLLEETKKSKLAKLVRQEFPEILLADHDSSAAQTSIKHEKKESKKKEDDDTIMGAKQVKYITNLTPARTPVTDVTHDEWVIGRLNNLQHNQLENVSEIRSLTLRLNRAEEKLACATQRGQCLLQEKEVLSVLEKNLRNKEISTRSARKEEFRRQQSSLYRDMNPKKVNDIDITDVEPLVHQVNRYLITEKECQYVYHILDLPQRHRFDFKLFTVIAALSEKVSNLEPFIKKMINKMDFEALDVKMNRAKELFYLLEDEDSELCGTGEIPLHNLKVELEAGGLSPEHVELVIDKFGRDGKQTVDFLDYVTYILLFIDIHGYILSDPLNSSRDR